MRGQTRLACVVVVSVIYVAKASGLRSLAPILKTTERGQSWKDYLGNVPSNVKSIAKFDYQYDQGLIGTQKITPQCSSVKKPDISTSVPSWASNKSTSTLKNTSNVTQVTTEQGKTVAAFEKDNEVVMKTCSTKVLNAVVWWVRVPSGKNATVPDYTIYFDCSGSDYTMKLSETLSFGKSSVAGKWRLVAPYQNITLDGKKKYRIMSLNGRGAVLTAYGITFYRGWSVCPVTSVSSGDVDECSGQNYGGGAILVNQQAWVVAHNCVFDNNRSDGLFARWSGGGAIKAETKAGVLIWGCTFENNQALTGGAIAVSSSYVLYVFDSTFTDNTAIGGMDGSQANKGDKMNKLLLLGGAIRVDSITGSAKAKGHAHVVLCKTTFEGNSIQFTKSRLTDTFDYTVDEGEQYLKAKGAAAYLWNTDGNLDVSDGDVQFTTVKNCTFASNFEKVEFDEDNSQMGAYVISAAGAGNTHLTRMRFQDNSVQKAAMLIDISSSTTTSDKVFQILCLGILFSEDTGPTDSTLAEINAEASDTSANCTFARVYGIPNGSGPCVTYLENS